MRIDILKEEFCICKIKNIDRADAYGDIFFLAKTADEISLVCSKEYAPKEVLSSEGQWRALKVAEQLDFSLVGIIAGITGVLAERGIPVFAASTYDTDYILVKDVYLDKATEALKDSGYAFCGIDF